MKRYFRLSFGLLAVVVLIATAVIWKVCYQPGQPVKPEDSMLEGVTTLRQVEDLVSQADGQGRIRELAEQVSHEIRGSLTPREVAAGHLTLALCWQAEAAKVKDLAAKGEDLPSKKQLERLDWIDRNLPDPKANFKAAIAADTGWLEARLAYASWLNFQGELQAARTQVGEILKLDPDFQPARQLKDFLEKPVTPGKIQVWPLSA